MSVVQPMTLKDVAEKAGVSLTTASRALNGKGRVAQQTRNKVLAAARALGYTGVPARNRTVGLLYSLRLPPLSTDAFYGPVIQSIETSCRRAGFYLSVAGIQPGDDRAGADDFGGNGEGGVDFDAVAETAYDYVANDDIDVLVDPYEGMIVLGADISPAVVRRLQRTGKPVVLVDNELDDGSADAVVIANRRGMYTVTDFLIRSGHRDIAYIGGPRHHVSLRQRYAGFKDCMNQAGLNVINDLVQYVDDVPYAMITGQVGVQRLVHSGQRFTAVVCDNDDVAVGAAQQLLQLGYAVPDQVSVTGFDGRPMIIRPLITTVHVPRAQIGDLAAARLFHLIDHQDAGEEPPVTITVSTSIVERETTARVREPARLVKT